jgi:SNF2 family DNA or RNA helicase
MTDQTTVQALPPLWLHQKNAIFKGLENDHLALLMEMGTGKTRALLEIFRRRCAQQPIPRILKTLILCPPIAIDNWKDEILKYTKIPAQNIFPVKGTSKQKMKILQGAMLRPDSIVITNYETVQNDDLFELLLKYGFEVQVDDESQRLKNPKSKRAKKVLKLADQVQILHKYILSGTPILNSALDIWMQYRILDGGETFGKNYLNFRDRYFEDLNNRWVGKPNYFPKWVPRVDKYPELSQRIGQKAIKAVKSECLDLPPLVKMRAETEMSPEQKRIYKELASEYVAEVTAMTKSQKPVYLVTELALSKALRMQQILTGYIPNPIADPNDDTSMLHKDVLFFDVNPRANALEELLEDLTPNHKVIVWACFAPNYKTIRDVCTKIGVQYAELHGGITGKAREDDKKRFLQDPNCRVLIANQQAGGVAINLVEASYSIYYSKNFNREHDAQSEARNYRGGSEIHDKITRIDLVTPGTIDDVIQDALTNKKAIGDLLLSWDVFGTMP